MCAHESVRIIVCARDTQFLEIGSVVQYLRRFGGRCLIHALIKLHFLSSLLLQLFETVTGREFSADAQGTTVLERIRTNLAEYF